MSERNATAIPGYDYGATAVSPSPISIEELRQLEESVGWTDEDAHWLQAASETLVPQAELMVDEWRAAIGRQPHLSKWFLKPDGDPDEAYKAAVKRRFVQWVSDLCRRPHDRDWLNYQEEIGIRHTPEKKNRTDGGHTPPLVPQRYLIGFSTVVITTVRSFLARSERSQDEITRMQDAWTRAVMLSIALWSRSYTRDGLW